MKLALDCPRQLQHTIDKKPHGRAEESFYSHLGKLVQKTFELYFNQGINLKAGGKKQVTILAAAARVIPHYLKTTQISYQRDQTEELLTREATNQISKGHETLTQMGLLNRRVRSEVKLNGVFRGFRMFALVDFLVELPEGDLLYDGKGHKEKNADPRQVLYYALNRAAAGRKIVDAGLIYWRYGYEKVDTSPKAIRDFIDTEFTRARPTFELLRQGTNELMETRPSPETCKYCNWRFICEDSYYKTAPTDPTGQEEVTFDQPQV